jgi:hypothetical protein
MHLENRKRKANGLKTLDDGKADRPAVFSSYMENCYIFLKRGFTVVAMCPDPSGRRNCVLRKSDFRFAILNANYIK